MSQNADHMRKGPGTPGFTGQSPKQVKAPPTGAPSYKISPNSSQRGTDNKKK